MDKVLNFTEMLKGLEDGSILSTVSANGKVSISPKIKLDALASEQLDYFGKEPAQKRAEKLLEGASLKVEESYPWIKIGYNIEDGRKPEEILKALNEIYPGQITFEWNHVNPGLPLYEVLSKVIVDRILAKEGVDSIDKLTIKSFENGSLSSSITSAGTSIKPNIKELSDNPHLISLGKEAAQKKAAEILEDVYLKSDNISRITIGHGKNNKSPEEVVADLNKIYPGQVTDFWKHVNPGLPLYEVLDKALARSEGKNAGGGLEEEPDTQTKQYRVSPAAKTALLQNL